MNNWHYEYVTLLGSPYRGVAIISYYNSPTDWNVLYSWGAFFP